MFASRHVNDDSRRVPASSLEPTQTRAAFFRLRSEAALLQFASSNDHRRTNNTLAEHLARLLCMLTILFTFIVCFVTAEGVSATSVYFYCYYVSIFDSVCVDFAPDCFHAQVTRAPYVYEHGLSVHRSWSGVTKVYHSTGRLLIQKKEEKADFASSSGVFLIVLHLFRKGLSAHYYKMHAIMAVCQKIVVHFCFWASNATLIHYFSYFLIALKSSQLTCSNIWWWRPSANLGVGKVPEEVPAIDADMLGGRANHVGTAGIL